MNMLTKIVLDPTKKHITSVSKSTLLLLSMLLLWGSATQAQTTYYWRGTATGQNNNNLWNEGTNWNTQPNGSGTARTPASNDILIFDGNAATSFPAILIVDFGNGQSAPFSQTIGQLRVVNNANVSLAGPVNGNDGSIISVTGGTASVQGQDLFVEGGSSISFVASGQTANRFLHIKIGTGKKGLIRGNIAFNATNQSRLLALDANGLVFTGSGSTTSANSLAGNPFGTTGANTVTTSNGTPLPNYSDVILQEGSVVYTNEANFRQRDGISPFGTGTAPVSIFEPGTKYFYESGTFSNVGQRYGFLSFDGSTNTTTVNGTRQMVVVNDLTVINGTINLNLTGTGIGTSAAVSLGGNLNANGGTLNFSPASTSTVAFNSPIFPVTTAIKRTISGIGGLSFNSSTIFEINNAEGLTLERPIVVGGGLRLTLGIISYSTNAIAPLSLPSTANIFDGRSSKGTDVGSFVNGPVARTTTGPVTNLSFPVGKVATNGAGNYRPMFLTTTNQNNAITYKGEQMETLPNQTFAANSNLTRVSFRRYFNLAPNVVPTSATGTTFSATVTLTFDFDDFVNYPQDNTFVIAKNDAVGNPWTNAGRSTAVGTANNGLPVAGTLTSAAFPVGPVTNFAPFSAPGSGSNFSLASTSTANGFPGVNPLPVALTRFAARAQASGIALDWATASEKNNERFEVERSADGTSFKAVGTVKGQGNSTSAHEYAFLDAKPLIGQSYYRLRQVDFDGATAFSPVATVNVERGNELAYPSPSNGTITLAASLGALEYRIINNLGQTVLRGHAAGNEHLNLTALPKGVYLLEIIDNTGRTTQRLLRE